MKYKKIMIDAVIDEKHKIWVFADGYMQTIGRGEGVQLCPCRTFEEGVNRLRGETNPLEKALKAIDNRFRFHLLLHRSEAKRIVRTMYEELTDE